MFFCSHGHVTHWIKFQVSIPKGSPMSDTVALSPNTLQDFPFTHLGSCISSWKPWHVKGIVPLAQTVTAGRGTTLARRTLTMPQAGHNLGKISHIGARIPGLIRVGINGRRIPGISRIGNVRARLPGLSRIGINVARIPGISRIGNVRARITGLIRIGNLRAGIPGLSRMGSFRARTCMPCLKQLQGQSGKALWRRMRTDAGQ